MYKCRKCGREFTFGGNIASVDNVLCSSCIANGDGFKKYDGEKIRLELIPPSFLTSTGVVLTYGAIKYDDNNWEKCPKWSRYYGALLRHLIAILGGEEVDSESGLPHLWHLNCNAAFLTEFQEAGIGEDDLPKRKYLDRSIMIQEAFKTAKELHDESA